MTQVLSSQFIEACTHHFRLCFVCALSRPEVRNSALEVLFDTLKRHGSSFAESFWKRVFDSVLLPIFDHVRAEVSVVCECALSHAFN